MITKLLLKTIALPLVLFTTQLSVGHAAKAFKAENAKIISFTGNNKGQMVSQGKSWNARTAYNRSSAGGFGVQSNSNPPFTVSNRYLYLANPEINVKGNGATIVDGDASPSSADHTDFGNQSACSGSIMRTFTIENTGTDNLTVSSVIISGTNASEFTVTSSPSSPVAASGTTTFRVTFDPSGTGL